MHQVLKHGCVSKKVEVSSIICGNPYELKVTVISPT